MTSPEEGLEGWGHKWKDTSGNEEPEETSGNLAPRARGRSTSLDTPGFGQQYWLGNSGLQNSERIIFCCLSHYIFRYVLQQPREMYILSYRVWRITLNFTQPCCLKFVPSVCFPSLESAPTRQCWKPQPPGVISYSHKTLFWSCRPSASPCGLHHRVYIWDVIGF